jgi:hypothetical protein
MTWWWEMWRGDKAPRRYGREGTASVVPERVPPTLGFSRTGPAGHKALNFWGSVTARLKPCPPKSSQVNVQLTADPKTQENLPGVHLSRFCETWESTCPLRFAERQVDMLGHDDTQVREKSLALLHQRFSAALTAYAQRGL